MSLLSLSFIEHWVEYGHIFLSLSFLRLEKYGVCMISDYSETGIPYDSENITLLHLGLKQKNFHHKREKIYVPYTSLQFTGIVRILWQTKLTMKF